MGAPIRPFPGHLSIPDGAWLASRKRAATSALGSAKSRRKRPSEAKVSGHICVHVCKPQACVCVGAMCVCKP